MSETIQIITLVISGLNLLCIPLLTKGIDYCGYLARHIKHSECSDCFKSDFREDSKRNLKSEDII
jgi:hypothetical protein